MAVKTHGVPRLGRMHLHHVSKLVTCSLVLAVAACGGGVIQAETELPLPATASKTGVVVEVPDGSSVCDRLQIYVYDRAPGNAGSMAFPTGVEPVVKTGGFGRYSKESPRCTMIANVAAGTYWVIVALPTSSFDSGGYPTLGGRSKHPDDWRAGRYPVVVEKGKTIRLDLTLSGYR